MDTTKPSTISASQAPSPFFWSPAKLFEQLQSEVPPLVVDVRKNEAFLASTYLLPSALRRDPEQVEQWMLTLPAAQTVLVSCVHGHEVSQNTAMALRLHGINAKFLEGGIEDWREQGLPLTVKAAGSATRWVTRERPKIDRIACPWLVRRFVDANAQFLYVPAEQVQAVAVAEHATAYDVNAAVADTPFTHDGAMCSFDAFIKIYRLSGDAALARLADIVRGADTGQLEVAPQAAGLLAVSLGMSLSHVDDHAMLQALMPVYDALYAWCRDGVAGKDEQHNWKTA